MFRDWIVLKSHACMVVLACLGLWTAGCSCDDRDPIVTRDAGSDATGDAGGFEPKDAGSDATGDAIVVDPAQQCVPSDVCGILDGSGCSDDMQCRLFQQEGEALTVSCRAQGEGALGSECSMDFDCGAGLVCYKSTCLQYCCYSASDSNAHMVCPDDAFCLLNYTSSEPESTPSPYGACVPQTGCDLVMQDCEGEGVGCYLLTRGNQASGYCLEAAVPAGQKGDACSANNDCEAGLLCVGEGECAPICDMTAQNGCAEGEICNDLETAPENVGVCIFQ